MSTSAEQRRAETTRRGGIPGQRAGEDPAGAERPRQRRPRGNLRWAIVGMCFLGVSINYLDRANLSIAMPDIVKEFGISHTVEGLILGGFFWTYALFQLPAGHFIDRFGARVTYGFAVIWWSVFTALTAVASGAGSLFGFRLGLGVGESASYPASAKVVSLWFPKRERALATSIYDSGARFGSAVALPLVAFLVAWLGWRASFVITGALGVVWAVGWVAWYRNPRSKSGLSDEELAYIESGGARADDPGKTGGKTGEETGEEPVAREAAPTAAPTVRWRQLFGYRTVWGMMLGFFCLNFVIYFFITWFPTYLHDARGFSLLGTGFYGVIPAIVAILGGWLGGWVSDRIYDRTGDLNKARKTCLVGGMLFSSVIALAVVVPSAWAALALLSLCYASLTFAAASVWSLPADVAPTQNQVASIGGIQNFASNLAGVGSPFLVGALYDATGSFVVPLVVVGCLGLLGAVAYAVIVKRVEPLPARHVQEGAAA
jgi:ACS family D-galactonate transporter-like MFS transporter